MGRFCLSGVVGYHGPWGKNNTFALPPTKTAEFEVKIFDLIRSFF